jgi:hypothetical protein
VFGGRLKRDKLGFLVAQRVSQTNNLIPLPRRYFHFPQGGFAASGGHVAPHSTIRLMWQATQQGGDGVLQVTGRHQTLRRRLHRDEL